jgi:hypothetical protein
VSFLLLSLIERDSCFCMHACLVLRFHVTNNSQIYLILSFSPANGDGLCLLFVRGYGLGDLTLSDAT